MNSIMKRIRLLQNKIRLNMNEIHPQNILKEGHLSCNKSVSIIIKCINFSSAV